MMTLPLKVLLKKGENSLPESKAGGNKILKVLTNNGDIEMDIKK